MKYIKTTIAVLLVSASASVAADQGEPLLIEGVAKLSPVDSGGYHWDTYADYRGGGARICLAYFIAPHHDKKPPVQQVVWTTVVPPEKKDVVFVFEGSCGEDPGEMKLFLNDEYILSFESSTATDRVWSNGPFTLAFKFLSYTVGNNGFYYLSVPADKISPGEACTLKVVPSDGREKSWFMVYDRQDNLTFRPLAEHKAFLAKADKMLAELKSGRVPPDAGRPADLPADKHSIVCINPPFGGGGDLLVASNGEKIKLPAGCAVERGTLRFGGSGAATAHGGAIADMPEMTVQAWVRIQPGKGMGRQVIISRDGTFELALYYGRPEGVIWLQGNKDKPFRTHVRQSKRMDDGRWHLLSMSYDGYLVQLFLDGRLYLAYPLSGKLAGSDAKVLLSSPDEPFRGWLGAASLANKARPLRLW